MKFNFNNVKIGDKIMTVNRQTGIVVMIRSYAYINDLIVRNETEVDTLLIDLMPFKFDNVRHQNIDYPAVTVAIETMDYGKKNYYLVDIDFNDIKKIITDDIQIIEEKPKYIRIYESAKNTVMKFINNGIVFVKNIFK